MSYQHPVDRAAAAARRALIERDNARLAENQAREEFERTQARWLESRGAAAEYLERATEEAAQRLHEAKQAARQAQRDYMAARIDAAVEAS